MYLKSSLPHHPNHPLPTPSAPRNAAFSLFFTALNTCLRAAVCLFLHAPQDWKQKGDGCANTHRAKPRAAGARVARVFVRLCKKTAGRGGPGAKKSLALLGLLLLTGGWLGAGCAPKQKIPTQADLLLPSAQGLAEYRRLILPNGLRVLLVSNPQAERSSAALSVGVGSLSDPAESQGLAHFLEHMLFLGSKKYPQPDSYAAFMAKQGGRGNAYTAPDHTNYHFSIPHTAFGDGLERLAQFFIAPLMAPRYASREMHAVDSEHGKNLENDRWRTHQVLRSTFVPKHPAANFSTGSLKTLKGVRRKTLLAFHRQYYSAGRMTLAMVSALPIKKLEAMAKAYFSPIRAGGEMPLRFAPQFLVPKAALRELRVQPVTNQRSLTLFFPLPGVRDAWQGAPLQLIAFVLGHEGKGSLLSLLKAEGLAESLSAGGGGEDTWDYTAFLLHIGLTPKGLAQRFKIAQYALGAIASLRQQGIPRSVFHQNQQLARIAHRTQKAPASIGRAIALSRSMQRLPLQALPQQLGLLQYYPAKRVKVLLQHFRVNNMLMLTTGPELSVTQTEPHYRARYAYQEYRDARYLALTKAKPDARWHLPLPNPFLPEALVWPKLQGPLQLTLAGWLRLQASNLPAPLLRTLKTHLGQTLSVPEVLQVVSTGNNPQPASPSSLPPQQTGGGAFGKSLGSTMTGVSGASAATVGKVMEAFEPQPIRIWHTPLGTLWQQPPWRLRQPKGALFLRFSTPNAYGTAHQAALAQLHAGVVAESMNELGYPMRLAGLHYSLSAVPEGMMVSVNGYAHGLPKVLHTLLLHAKNPQLSPSDFARIKQQQLRALQNQRMAQPYAQAFSRRRVLLQQPGYTREALSAALQTITLAQVKRHAQTLLQQSHVQGALAGALTPRAAKAALLKGLALWQAKPLPKAQRTRLQAATAPRDQTQLAYTERLPTSNSSAVLHVYAGQDTPEMRAVLNLVSQALGQRYYTQLRTQQQLGYIVFAGAGRSKQQLHLTFVVQSNRYSADDILTRTRAFIPTFMQEVALWSDAQFEGWRKTAIKKLLERSQSIDQQAQTLFDLAYEHQGDFTRISQGVTALQALTKAPFLAALERIFHPQTSVQLAIRMLGKNAPQPQALDAKVLRLP